MAKIQRITPTESATVADLEEPTEIEPKTLTFDLARNRGVAVFREPTAADLSQVELAVGRMGSAMDHAKLFEFCRRLARLCCIQWGVDSTMPESERIRVQDDQSAIALFATQLNQAEKNPDDFSRVLDGESSRNDGFDAYEVTLSDGTVLIFDEPTQLDNQRREKGKTATDGNVQFAAALCKRWNGQPIQWTEALSKLRSLSLEDFFRVSVALTFFRG